MSRAEERAKQAYPYEGGTKGMICDNSIPIYIQGYEQAINDAMQWLTDHLKYYIDYDNDGSIGNFDDDALLEGFDRAMR